MTTWVRSAVILLLAAAVTVGADAQMRKGKLGVGVGGSMYMYSGEYSTKTSKYGGGLSVAYNPFEFIGLRTLVGVGQFGYKVTPGSNTLAPLGGEATTTFVAANVYLTGHLMPNSRFNPYVSVGTGYIYFDPRTDNGIGLALATTSKSDFNYFVGGGFDLFLSEFWSISGTGEMCISNTDRFDGAALGPAKDGYLRFGVELRYYFFDQSFMTKMLEALKARYE